MMQVIQIDTSKASSYLLCLVGDAQGHHSQGHYAPLGVPVYVMIANVCNAKKVMRHIIKGNGSARSIER